MKNILLPTDFSENSWNAIRYALDFLKNEQCNFYILHVNKIENLIVGDTHYIPTQQEIEVQYTKPAKAQLKNLLFKINALYPDHSFHKFYTLTDYNFLIESIRKQVAQKKIDMIVMGTKGASGLQEYLVGSNAGDVITKVKCSTLIVPEKAKFKKLEEVAFPTDFALSYDIQTLEPMTHILNIQKAALRVLHIAKQGTTLNLEQRNNKELLEDFLDGYPYSFHQLTNNKVEDAVQCFVESRDIDMMVMIAKNLNYFQSILFHSKVEKISYHTHVPFLVLHE